MGLDDLHYETAEAAHLVDMQNLFWKELARPPKPAMMEDLISRFPSQVALAGRQLVGFAYCSEATLSFLELVNILVAEDWRDAGVGAILLRKVEELAKQEGYAAIVLYNNLLYGSAGTKRSAVSFYAAHGYNSLRLNANVTYCYKDI